MKKQAEGLSNLFNFTQLESSRANIQAQVGWHLPPSSLLLPLLFPLVDLEKNAQRESFELSFIWGKMRTAAWETAFQIALRNWSEEARGELRI